MDRTTKEALRKVYRAELTEKEAELSQLASSSEEFGRRSLVTGVWEDRKPREIALLERTISEYEELLRGLG